MTVVPLTRQVSEALHLVGDLLSRRPWCNTQEETGGAGHLGLDCGRKSGAGKASEQEGGGWNHR